jgi:SAM-dependent methyltransferase
MPEYVDYAEYYDYDHDTQIDIAFYLEYARQCGSPVLELACGTGRVLIPIAQAGHTVYGVDLSKNMLDVCRRKVEEQGLGDRVHLALANMASFDLPRKDFCLATIPVRSFMHLYTQEDQLACLRRAYAHLAPGGLLILDVYAPSYKHMARDPDGPWEARRQSILPNGHCVVREDRFVRNDPATQIQHCEIRFTEYDVTGKQVRKRRLSLDTRYTFRYEMQLLLERAGFEVLDIWRDYDKNPFDGTGEIIPVARRPAAHGSTP